VEHYLQKVKRILISVDGENGSANKSFYLKKLSDFEF